MARNPAEESINGPGTVVGVNVALTGVLKDQNDIVVYGMVDGEVISERSVTVGQTAQVKGPIRGETVTISGVVRGSIEAGDKLELTDTGKVYGSIVTKDLVVHSGAVIIGKVTMGSEEEETTTAAEVETTPPDEEDETPERENSARNHEEKDNRQIVEVVEEQLEETELTPDEE